MLYKEREKKERKTTIPEDSALLKRNIKRALLFLTVRYLKHHYQEINVFRGINKNQSLVLEWEEIEGMTDLWLGL